jgi:hypothetical protein
MLYPYSKALSINSKSAYEDHIRAYEYNIKINELASKKAKEMAYGLPLSNAFSDRVLALLAAKQNFVLGWQAKDRLQKSHPKSPVTVERMARAFAYDAEHNRLWNSSNLNWRPENASLSTTQNANTGSTWSAGNIDWKGLFYGILTGGGAAVVKDLFMQNRQFGY